MVEVFECDLCKLFRALSLRSLLSHYHTVHSKRIDFKVTCNVDKCPAVFTKYNSLYRHVRRHHEVKYNVTEQSNYIGNDDNDGSNDEVEVRGYNLNDNEGSNSDDYIGDEVRHDHEDSSMYSTDDEMNLDQNEADDEVCIDSNVQVSANILYVNLLGTCFLETIYHLAR